jgi:uncharacterized protein YndB with AHSA1/START domain
MKYALIVVAVIAVAVLMVLIAGWMLPVGHRATREATYGASPAEIFRLITDVDAFPDWRPSVKKVEVLPAVNGHSRFREIGRNGAILYEVDTVVPNERLIGRIADRSLPFGGKWTYELSPVGDSTTLRITEDGEIYNPIFRFASRFIIGQTATIDQYLGDVGKRLGRASR